PANIRKLQKDGGLCVVYTHFASGFINNGKLDETFKNNLDFLSQQNGWFAPASEILDYLKTQNKRTAITPFYVMKLDIKWLIDRIIKKYRYKR
ncbi:MAG: hypothetical protein QNK26_18785, partial [Moritella sp.]|uniref:hypothetical protein n=1 Tax=Moritella sp. TaxID=78556 RepID=UPI0029BF8B49